MNDMHGTEIFEKLDPDKKGRVFNAAVEEFALNGYRKSSMNTISREAGVSKGSLFQYFTNKDGLFESLISLATSKVKNYLKEVRDRTNGRSFFERFELLILSGFDFIDNNPRLAKIYFHLLSSNDAPFGSKIVSGLNKKSRQFLESMISEGIESGELQENTDQRKTAFLLNAMLEQLLKAYYMKHLAPDLKVYKTSKDELKLWTEIAVGLIRNGLKGE